MLYFTKDEGCRHWKLEMLFPERWLALCRYGVPDDEVIALVRKLVAGSGLELLFVGDLDPHDLTTFAVLRNGSALLQGKPRDALPVRYLGIDDRWLHLCEKHLERGRSLDRYLLPMDRLEAEHFSLVREMLPDLKELVGPRCFDVLASGRTLDFISAWNPALYRESFGRLLLDHLRRARPAPVSGRRTGRGAASRS